MKNHVPGLLAASCFVCLLMPTLAGAQAARSVTLQGPSVRVEATADEGRLEERYWVRAGHDWTLAASSAGQSVGPVSLMVGGDAMPGKVERVETAQGALVEHFTVGPHRVTRTIRFVPERGDGWLRVTTRLEPGSAFTLHSFSDVIRFAERPDWSYAPSVGGFIPDGQYKAPVVLVQAGPKALALVPDVDTLSADVLRRCYHALQLDVPAGPLLSAGFTPCKNVGHAVYGEDKARNWTAQAPVENSYYMLVSTAEPQEAYRQVVRFHWQQFGGPAQAEAAVQQTSTHPVFGPKRLTLWDEWRAVVWDQQAPAYWLRVPLPGGGQGGAVKLHRMGKVDSIYTTSWFQSLRTSYGMALYAQRTGKQALVDQAGENLDFALGSPGVDGAFKCIALTQPGGTVKWAAGDGALWGTEQGFLGYDMAWTGYWLLRWHKAKLPGSERILPRVQRLAEFFLARQTADGLLPTRFNEDGSVDLAKSIHVKAECGPVALFLLELYTQDPKPEYLSGALKGLAYLDKEVIPLRQWYDYETFWSCSPRGIAFDERTQQWPANNLALSQTTQAYLEAWRITKDPKYLRQGEALLDYLLLYQQCWTNPILAHLSCRTMLLGGFTTQNADAEWSDWRQSQIGNTLIDYHRATGNPEYLLRGVAALRASFPIAPSENWAHHGYGTRASVSSFHTGTGSGMAGIEIDNDYLGDVVVDIKASRAVGVNGINVTKCEVSEDQVQLAVNSPVAWTRPARLVLHNAQPGRRYRVIVNERDLGRFDRQEMERGIPLSMNP